MFFEPLYIFKLILHHTSHPLYKKFFKNILEPLQMRCRDLYTRYSYLECMYVLKICCILSIFYRNTLNGRYFKTFFCITEDYSEICSYLSYPPVSYCLLTYLYANTIAANEITIIQANCFPGYIFRKI